MCSHQWDHYLVLWLMPNRSTSARLLTLRLQSSVLDARLDLSGDRGPVHVPLSHPLILSPALPRRSSKYVLASNGSAMICIILNSLARLDLSGDQGLSSAPAFRTH